LNFLSRKGEPGKTYTDQKVLVITGRKGKKEEGLIKYGGRGESL